MSGEIRSLFGADQAANEMFEAIPQGVIAVDLHSRICCINANACQMFGYAHSEIVGQQLGILLPDSLRARHAEHFEDFIAEPQRRMMGYGTGELWGRREDGTSFPVDVGLSSVIVDGTRLALAFVSDVSERHRSHEELRQSREKLQELARQATTAAEEESRKWARELHDVYSQRLVGLAMELARIARGKANREAVGSVESKVRALAEDIHHLSRSMHPNILHDLGLVAALKSELEAFEHEQGVQTQFERSDVPRNLPADVALCFYRVAQESLRNIRKHSGATRVKVQLAATDGGLHMVVEDEGDGFDLEQALRRGGLGLISMEERVLGVGGTFSVDSTPGRGTAVYVTVPLGESN